MHRNARVALWLGTPTGAALTAVGALAWQVLAFAGVCVAAMTLTMALTIEALA